MPAAFPTPFVVTVHAYAEGAPDVYGQPQATWTARAPERVYGVAPAATDEPAEVGRHAITYDADVYAPAEVVIQPRDRVQVGPTMFEVVGRPEIFDHGPFGYQPGQRVRLRVVEG